MCDYQQMTDEELLMAYHKGDEDVMDYICMKYKPLVLSKAKSMYLIGGETDDLIQEGMLGLFKAIRDYDTTKNVTFFHFARLCISRQMDKAIEASNRKKNQPLNSYISLYPYENQEQDALDELFEEARVHSPETILIDSETVKSMKKKVMDSLSPFEQQVLELYLIGYDYKSIAQKLGKTDKGIDNAIQRIRQKVRKFYH